MRIIIINPPLSMSSNEEDPRTAAIEFRLAVEEIAVKVSSRLRPWTSVKIFHHRGASTVAIAKAIVSRLGRKQIPVNILERPFHSVEEVRTCIGELVSPSDFAIVIEPGIQDKRLLPGAAIQINDGETQSELIVRVEQE